MIAGAERIRVLVVDDSAVNRRSIADALSQSPEVEIVGKAADGEEALRLALLLKPDVLTLDLEMPRMDGFTFLRILMSRQPTPVVVVSSYSQKENVFKALELGALDFVAKPDRQHTIDLSGIRDELLAKVLMVRGLRASALAMRPRMESISGVHNLPAPSPRERTSPVRVIAIAASTGGPTALLEVFRRLPDQFSHAVLVAQHMPDKFTRTFAARLDRGARVAVSEAADGDGVCAGFAYVCPGRHCMELERDSAGALRLGVAAPGPSDRYVPSADRLFASLARSVGPKAVAVILTGMGDDGAEGAAAVLAAGGLVVAESEQSAVVYGMPGAAVRRGVVSRSLGITQIADFLSNL